MNRNIPLLLLALIACNKDKNGEETGGADDSGPVVDDSGGDDTGGGDDSNNPDTPCTTVPLEISPEDGESGWYFLDPLSITFSESAASATITLKDSAGAEVPTTVDWGEGALIATVTPDGGLAGSTTYTLDIAVCEYTGSVSFTTDVYGDPMSVEPSSLIGLTYVFDLGQAEITEPENLGYLLAYYLTQPLLIGVQDATDTEITLIGAQGKLKNDGTYSQYGTDVWYFPAADFTAAPYFSASTDAINISYSGYDIPLEDFHLEGTFAPDGSSIGGGFASGMGDTRNMGPLLGLDDDPNAVCALIDGLELGVSCDSCSDGEPYCLYLEVEFANSYVADGVTIE